MESINCESTYKIQVSDQDLCGKLQEKIENAVSITPNKSKSK